MEDYYGAFLSRALDTESLLNGNRTVGSVHMGAISIECLLKSLIVERHNITGWGSNQDGTMHGITNPGHEFIDAIHKLPELRKRIPRNMISYFERLQQPRIHYIDMRYDGVDLDDHSIQEWKEAYIRVRAWLLSQRSSILKGKRA
ncbi:hypothetical protein [Paenibacillus helianthi]|nr:hypothetical protein [Paenibacillus helianthi]